VSFFPITSGSTYAETFATLRIHVRSAAEQAELLQSHVDQLRLNGVLNGGQTTALNSKLSLKGNGGDVGRVNSFINQVLALFRAHILTQDQANSLLDAAADLLAGLQ
jgi:hypothetical protein